MVHGWYRLAHAENPRPWSLIKKATLTIGMVLSGLLFAIPVFAGETCTENAHVWFAGQNSSWNAGDIGAAMIEFQGANVGNPRYGALYITQTQGNGDDIVATGDCTALEDWDGTCEDTGFFFSVTSTPQTETYPYYVRVRTWNNDDTCTGVPDGYTDIRFQEDRWDYTMSFGSSTAMNVDLWELEIGWTYATDTGNGYATSIHADHFSAFLGSATGTFPVCLINPWFTFLDTFHGLTSGDLNPQTLTVGLNGEELEIDPSRSLLINDFRIETLKNLIWDVLAMILWSSLGFFVLWDLFLRGHGAEAADEG